MNRRKHHPSTSKVLLSVTLTGAAFVVAFPGCNTLLDNEPGVLAVSEEAGTLPGEPSPQPPASPTPPAPSPTAPTPTPPPDAGGGVDAGGCPAGQHACNGQCVAVTDPTYGCGSPTCAPCVVAHGVAACVAGACGVGACDPGFADCNANAADGCEVDLARPATCGSCTTACPPATPTCAPIGATYQCTTGCPPLAPAKCGEECVDLLSSANHCGACGAKCPDVANATSACAAGACTYTCRPEFRACGGRCVTRTDPAACGPACVACPVPANGTAACIADACTAQCSPGFADCDASPANGCETTLANNPLHCGACGRSCNGGACVNGVCQAAPDAAAPPPP